jgi:hypothetical protein
MLTQSIGFGASFVNVFIRLFYIPLAVVSWLLQLLSQWRLFLIAFAIGGASLIVVHYVGTAASNIEFVMRCRINIYYEQDIRPVISGIVRQFVNRMVCWYDAVLYFPYGFGRRVVFPILREGGFGPTLSAFARFLSQVGQDMFIDFFFTNRWFSEPLDFTNIYLRWQEFWTLWQALLCYGCNDLCPFFTKTPIFPSFFGSDQIKDTQFLCTFGNMFNALLVVVQQLIFILREIIFPTQSTLPYLNFRAAFEFMCQSSSCWFRSWENALQVYWDTFVPFEFKWVNMLCFMDSFWCAIYRTMNLIVDMLIHANQIVAFFANTDRTYVNVNVKHMFIEIINTLGTATFFAPIVAPIQNTTMSMTITNYQLRTDQPSTPWGAPNILYRTNTTAQCLCIALSRLLCDPLNNGTTCLQRFNGTLLTGINPCCFTNNLGTFVSDYLSGFFEFTLHLFDFDDFILYTDKNPFSGLWRDNLIRTINCLYQIFRSIKVYGKCLEIIMSELTLFIISTYELIQSIIISLLTLPYFQAFLPQTCNFISCPGDMALNMTIQYLDRISDPTNPNGLINCLCYILNSGFNVPYAGCNNVTCVPMGFIQPTTMSKKRWNGRDESFYDYATRTLGGSTTYRDKITPIITYKQNAKPNAIEFGIRDFAKIPKDALLHLDNALKKMSIDQQCSKNDKRSLVYNNFTDSPLNCNDPMNPPPCFDLCCLPTKLILLAAQIVGFGARALNAAFQTRFTDGSTYWNGNACPESPCFASDLVATITLSFAPISCLCEFIKLVLPPQGFKDVCCAISIAGELLSVMAQILINVGNSISGDSPNFSYIRGNQTFNTTGTTATGIPLVDDFTVLLSLVRTLFDCVCDFIRSIFAVAFSGFQQFKAFDPCCLPRVYLRAILELLRTSLRLVLALVELDGIPGQQFLYVNGYKNARPFCPFFIGDVGLVRELKNITKLLLAPPVSNAALMGCAAVTNLDEYNPNNEGIPTCLCNTASAVLAMINAVDPDMMGNLSATPKCMLNICCPIFKLGLTYKALIDFFIEFVATLWQNWEFKKDFDVGVPPKINFFFPQETINYFFCDEYEGIPPSQQFLRDGVTRNPYYSVSYLSISESQLYYAPFQDNKPDYPDSPGFRPNNNTNATTGIVNANTPYDSNNPELQRAKCGSIETILGAAQSFFQDCLCMAGDAARRFDPLMPDRPSGACGFDFVNTTNGTQTIQTNGIGNMFDDILRWLLAFVTKFAQIFPFQLFWPNCLCCGGPENGQIKGMLVPFGNMYVVGLRQLLQMFRNLANPTYWSMNGGSIVDNPGTTTSPQGFVLTGLKSDYDDFRRTWINRFLAPFADALCLFITNSGCLLSLILGETCTAQRYPLISSVVRYYMEAWIHGIALIEGFIKLFSNEQPGQCVGGANLQGNAGTTQAALESQGMNGPYQQMVPTCSPKAGMTQQFSWKPDGKGFNPDQLGRILVAVLQFIVDAFIGFSELACSTLCPKNINKDSACDCYNLSPYINWGDIPRDRCGRTWELFNEINGWVTLFRDIGLGTNTAFYPPGTQGCYSGVIFLGQCFTWENYPCEKNTPVGPFASPQCGNVCAFWMINVFCEYYKGPVNPAPMDNVRCATLLLPALFDQFTGVSMQKRYNGNVWKRVSEIPCPTLPNRINYCLAEVPSNFPYVPPAGAISAEIYILSTILQTSSLQKTKKVPIYVPGMNYSITECDSTLYDSYYGTAIGQPYGAYSITQAIFNTPNNTAPNLFGYPQIRTNATYEGSCNWFQTQCSRDSLDQKFRLIYGYANKIYQSTGFEGENPWNLCCNANTPGGVNWNSVVNITEYPTFVNLPQPPQTPDVFAFFNVSVSTCSDPVYSEFGWMNQIKFCNANTTIYTVIDLMQVHLRNCLYAGKDAYDTSYLTIALANEASNSAASNCDVVGSVCIPGTVAIPPNLPFSLVWDELQFIPGYSFQDRLNEYPLIQELGQCNVCKLEAAGCKPNGFRPAIFQPLCDRKSCLALGWCKNDLLVPCNALTNPMILDGVIIAALRYFACVSENVFGNLGNFATIFRVLFQVLITILKFFWQISGGLIRLVVTLVMVVLDIFVTFVNDLAFGSALDILLNVILGPLKIAIISFQHFEAVFRAFIDIFEQPLVSKRIPLSQVAPVISNLKYAYNFHDGHKCVIEDPTFCFCQALDMRHICYVLGATVIPRSVKLWELIPEVRKHFNGHTNCDMLFEHLSSMNIWNWTSVPFSERFQAMECLNERAKGESFNRAIPIIPVDFFYNPYAMFKAIVSILSDYSIQASRYIRNDHAKITKDTFNEKFLNMTRDEYYRTINLRGYRVQDYYKQVLKINEKSLVWDTMLKLDTYYFQYQTGYYHMLLNKFAFMNQFGMARERWEIAKEEMYNMVHITKNIYTEADELYGPSIRNIPPPPTPQLIRMILDGSLWKGWKRQMTFGSTFEGIKVNIRPWEVEKLDLWPTINWTPEITRNWEAGKRMFYSMAHTIWPHYTTKEVHDRFVANGNCRLYDGAVELGSTLLDYCINEFVENTPTSRSLLGDYLAKTSHLRKDSFFRHHKGRIYWQNHTVSNYTRARINTTTAAVVKEKRHVFHRKTYSRATSTPVPTGAGGFFLNLISDLFGIDLLQLLDNFSMDFTNWVQNPNTNPADYPNVGAKYWFSFMIRCEFPYNMNCSIGIGLSNAMAQVGLVYIVIFLVCAFTFPAILSFLSVLFSILVYAIVVMIVAWHYSPACILLFPAMETYPGVTIPIFPIPITPLPIIPFCIWDDIIEVLDNVFASCYTWIPQWMLNTAQCLPCDQKLGFVSCLDVGIVNPLDVITFWGYQIFGPSFCDIMISISSALSFIPFLGSDKTISTCMALNSASGTQLLRTTLCGGLSLGTLAWVIAILYALGVFIVTVGLALINFLHSLILLLPFLWIFNLITGVDKPEGVFTVDGEESEAPKEEEKKEEEDNDVVKLKLTQRQDLAGFVATGIRRYLIPAVHAKTE